MSAPAWMPFYPADYLAGTGHLTRAQHGAYLLLILHYWSKGGLPADDRLLARIARMSDREWKAEKALLLALFKDAPFGVTTTDAAIGIGRSGPRPAIPSGVRREVRRRDGGVCSYCGSESAPFHFDHELPWSRGGRHTIENIRLSCAPCNLSKGAKTVEEWKQ